MQALRRDGTPMTLLLLLSGLRRNWRDSKVEARQLRNVLLGVIDVFSVVPHASTYNPTPDGDTCGPSGPATCELC